MGNGIKGDIKF